MKLGQKIAIVPLSLWETNKLRSDFFSCCPTLETVTLEFCSTVAGVILFTVKSLPYNRDNTNQEE
jgi:hypothetical protein